MNLSSLFLCSDQSGFAEFSFPLPLPPSKEGLVFFSNFCDEKQESGLNWGGERCSGNDAQEIQIKLLNYFKIPLV